MTSNYRCITIDLSTEAVGERREERRSGAVGMYNNSMFTDIFCDAKHTLIHTYTYTNTHTGTVDAAADEQSS